jgi:hypothetical protein
MVAGSWSGCIHQIEQAIHRSETQAHETASCINTGFRLNFGEDGPISGSRLPRIHIKRGVFAHVWAKRVVAVFAIKGRIKLAPLNIDKSNDL